jgi:hypothetical protein
MAIRLLNTSLKRTRKSRFFRCSLFKKLFRMAFRHLETPFHRIQQNCVLRVPEGRL